MVFRRLPITGLLVAVLAQPSCDDSSSDAQRVSISLGIDSDSCGTESIFTIQCSSEIRVRVEGPNGEALSGDCVSLGEDRLSITEIGQILSASTNLGTLETDIPLRIYLSVYPSSGDGSCLGDPNEIPYIEGATPLVTLGELSDTLSLLLRCNEPVGEAPVPPTGECNNCDLSLEQCLEDMGVANCQDAESRCIEQCQDPQGQCQVLCGLSNEYCQPGNDGGIELNCSGLLKSCQVQCQEANNDCGSICMSLEVNCMESSDAVITCQEQAQNCPDQCDQQASCLTL